MKRICRVGRVLLVFVPASYFANLFYDLFIATTEKRWLFFVWAFPCLHLVWVSMRLAMMLTGRRYEKYEKFTIIKTHPMPMCKLFPMQIRLNRFFFVINVGERQRVVSGLFWRYPSFILAYRNAFDKLKALTIGSIVIKGIWILGNLSVLAVLRLLIL
jgi:hypothetical protein